MSVEDEMSPPVRVVELDDTPLGPLVGYGQRSPMEDDGSCADREKVLSRVTYLHCTAVLDQIH